jgi:hypothetical protein
VRHATLLLFLVGGPMIRPLSASIVSYNYSGTVVMVSSQAQTATGVKVGDTLTGSFTYDSTQSGSGGLYTFTGSSKVHSFAFKVFNSAGAQVFSDQYSGNVTAYYAIQLAFSSSTGTSMDIMGDTIYKQGLGVTGPGPPPAFSLTLSNPTNAGGYSATHLPLPDTTLIKNFISTTAVLNWDPSGQTIEALVNIPEPSGLVLGSIAIATWVGGCVIVRRRLGASRRSGRIV